ncbi:glycosyltransferase [Cohnella panacarvi]|uniref:glycosyltransferase n=1 Tax=Cohnella panacarvi TaxID=400776 RepID=UPI00047EF7F9|nr:glycosyltransferase [Cohnella panacarvi]
MNILMVSSYPPRKCGVGEFAFDLAHALMRKSRTNVGIAALVTEATPQLPEVVMLIRKDHRPDYSAVANAINGSRWDVVVVQHEFGLYGGIGGEWVLDLIANLRKPVITVIHTLDTAPVEPRAAIVGRIAAMSNFTVTATRHGQALLPSFGGAPERTAYIPLGAPDNASVNRDALRAAYGVSDHVVAMTFGLLNPNKGIEFALDALPTVAASHPQVLYWIVGEPHPDNAESAGYYSRLQARAHELGLGRHVHFMPVFHSQQDLLHRLTAADIYLSPHGDVNFAFASATLTYAARTGKPILSTPTIYAQELLGDGTGILVPFGDVAAIASQWSDLIGDANARRQIEARSRNKGASFDWSLVADEYWRLAATAAKESVRRGLPSIDDVRGRTRRRRRKLRKGKRGRWRRRVVRRGKRRSRRTRRLLRIGRGRRRLRLRRGKFRRGVRARRYTRRARAR